MFPKNFIQTTPDHMKMA
jgi:hypothetical protein